MLKTYKDLIVWQKAIALVLDIYQETSSFPKNEVYGLVSQMRRASVSIPSNIAEGRRRSSRADFRRFLYFAYGSGAELETQLIICYRLHYISQENFNKLHSLLVEIMKILSSMVRKL